MTVTGLPGARRRLPNKRRHEIRDLFFRGRRYVVGIGRFEDGGIAEVFIDAEKASNDLADAARDLAISLSLAMQYGVPAEAIRGAATRDHEGRPAGIIGAVLDLLAQEAAP